MLHSNSDLFFIDAGFPDGDYTMAYLASERPASLENSWQTEALVYLFLGAAADALDQGVLLRALQQFLAAPLHQRTRFLWVENPADPLSRWRSQFIPVVNGPDGTFVKHLTYIDFRNYSLAIPRNAKIELNGEKNGFLIRHKDQKRRPQLTTAYGQHRLRGEQDIALPMQGAHAGCLEFELAIEKKGTAREGFGYPGLAQLDAGIRLFMRDPDFPGTEAHYYISSHRYPLWDEYCDNSRAFAFYPDRLSFEVCLDPVQPLSADRSCFIAKAPAGIDTGIPSAFRTNLGYTVHLLPEDKQSKLVFAQRPVFPAESFDTPLYLTPAGDFEIQVPDYIERTSAPTADNLVCGISGLEYIKIPRDKPMLISFNPGRPAFASSFVSATALLRNLARIIESYSQELPDEETADLDINLYDEQGLTSADLQEILDHVRLNYFPPGFQFSPKARTEYQLLKTVEDLIDWFRINLQALQHPGIRADDPLHAFPSTSWAYVRGKSKEDTAVYYAQPEQAVMHQGDAPASGGTGMATKFLEYLEVPSVGLPNIDHVAFPLLPYGQVDGSVLTDLRELELRLISNLRRTLIAQVNQENPDTPLLATAPTAETVEGTTPQGLMATFAADFREIKKLLLAVDTDDREIAFAKIGHPSPLKTALQSNQLFLVASDPAVLQAYFSKEVLKEFPGADNKMTIQDWGFEWGPEFWDRQRTILLFKFHDKPLIDLVTDTKMWSLPGQFNKDPAETGKRLHHILQEAIRSSQSEEPKERLKWASLARAALYEEWSGIIALNVHVPLGELPPALMVLAAGIDPDKFYAQYVGVELTPVEPTTDDLIPGQSSLFGLIDYRNDKEPPPHESGYNFHVPNLSVVFQNSLVKDFAAEVIVTLDRLFDEWTQLQTSFDGANTVLLKGTAETHNGKTTYAFNFAGDNHFQCPESDVLNEVQILRAQLVTDPLPAGDIRYSSSGNCDGTPISGRFFFWGHLNFRRLQGFDALSFGQEDEPPLTGNDKYLSFSGLQLLINFTLPAFSQNESDEVKDCRNFIFEPRGLIFDLKRSRVREQSLYAKFPLIFKRFIYSQGEKAIDELGFMPAITPLRSKKPESTWYAMTYDLELGTLGALTGGTLTASILLAWTPGGKGNGVYIGLKLPGSSGGKKEIVIQGVLKIVFKRIQFVVDESNPERTSYLLKLKNIILKFFVLSFPPNAATEIIIFGDPDATAEALSANPEKRSVGWYAAYSKKE